MRWFVFVLAASLLLAGCSNQITGSVVDERCSGDEVWCASQNECVVPWEDYCPGPGEDDRLMTASDCEYKGGVAIDYGAGKRCSEDQRVIGEVAGLISLHVCCYPRPEGWQGY